MAGFRASLVYSYLSKYLTLFSQIVTSIILARLLTPRDIGIFTVAAVFVGLGHLLREFGVNLYIVQEKELTDDRIRAAFTVNILFGWGVALVLFLLQDTIGKFYSSDEVRQVVGLLCINFLLVPMGAITFAHIRREMRFQHTLVIQVGGSLVSAIVVLVSAYYFKQAYLSLVWSAIAGTLATVLLTFMYRAPGLPLLPGFREIPHVLAFCKYAGPNALITYIGTTAPDWILGKVMGMSAVGLFSRASGTIGLFSKAFMEGLGGVALPHFSKQHREEEIDKEQYLSLVASITAVAWPFFATLAVLSEPVIRVLYGVQWVGSVPALQVLCVSAMLLYTVVLVEQVLVATGHIRRQLIINTSTQVLTILAVASGAVFGLTWVAWGLAVAGLIRVVAYQIAGQSILGLSFTHYTDVFMRNILLTVLTSVIPLMAVLFLGEDRLASIIYLGGVLIITGLVWVWGVWLIRSPLWKEIMAVLDNLLLRYRKFSSK